MRRAVDSLAHGWREHQPLRPSRRVRHCPAVVGEGVGGSLVAADEHELVGCELAQDRLDRPAVGTALHVDAAHGAAHRHVGEARDPFGGDLVLVQLLARLVVVLPLPLVVLVIIGRAVGREPEQVVVVVLLLVVVPLLALERAAGGAAGHKGTPHPPWPTPSTGPCGAVRPHRHRLEGHERGGALHHPAGLLRTRAKTSAAGRERARGASAAAGRGKRRREEEGGATLVRPPASSPPRSASRRTRQPEETIPRMGAARCARGR